jgi:hypothetical protein
LCKLFEYDDDEEMEYDDEEMPESSQEDEAPIDREAAKAEETVLDSGLLQAILTKETPEVESLLADFQTALA